MQREQLEADVHAMGVADDAIARAEEERALYQKSRFGLIVDEINARQEHHHLLANKVGDAEL